VVIKSPQGTIIHTGDFKFDNSPSLEPVADYNTIARIGSEGVLALLSDSTNSFIQGHSKSESYINDALQDIVEVAKGRVIISTFSSLVTRIIELLDIAYRTNRKVIIIGRSMSKILEISSKLGYLGRRDKVIIPIEDINKYPDKRIMIMATGAQGEEMAALPQILHDKNPYVKIKKGDSVILSSSVIPGNAMPVQGLIDDLSIKGAYVFRESQDMDLHTSGHGHQEDQKIMLNLTKPRFFIPVHGYQSFLYKHAQTAQAVGMDEKSIIIPKNGQVIELLRNSYKVTQTIRCTPVLISGSGVGDIGEQVLKERQQLGNNGLVLISMNLTGEGSDKKVNHVQIITKGFTFYKENTKLFDEIENLAIDMVNKELSSKTEFKEIKQIVIKVLSKYIYKIMSREPMILVILKEATQAPETLPIKEAILPKLDL
jgi:ribonuclease J